MTRLRYNLLQTTLGAQLTAAATTVTFATKLTAADGDIPTISGGDYLPLVIETEILWLTAYTSGATSGTVTRGEEDTTAATHASAKPVRHGPTATDFAEMVAQGGSLTAPLDTGGYLIYCGPGGDTPAVNPLIAHDAYHGVVPVGQAGTHGRAIPRAISNVTQADYDVLSPHDDATVYITDAGRIYLGTQLVANWTPATQTVPDPTGQTDGKILVVADDALVYADAPSGGGVIPLPADGPVGQYRSNPIKSAHTTATIGSNLPNSFLGVQMTPMVVLRPTSFDRIGLYVSTLNTGGTAGSCLLELGWCASDDYGVPDLSTMVSGGTEDIVSGVARLVEKTVSVTLDPGLWYLCASLVSVGVTAGTNPAFYADGGVTMALNYVLMNSNNSGAVWHAQKLGPNSITTAYALQILGGSPNTTRLRVGMRVSAYP